MGWTQFWTLVIRQKEGMRSWHWLLLYFDVLSLGLKHTYAVNNCALAAGCISNGLENIVWFAADVDLGNYHLASKAACHRNFILDHRALGKNPSPNDVVYGVDTILNTSDSTKGRDAFWISFPTIFGIAIPMVLSELTNKRSFLMYPLMKNVARDGNSIFWRG